MYVFFIVFKIRVENERVEEMGEFFWIILFGVCIWVLLIWNKIVIGKCIVDEEKKVGCDLIGEINLFIGGRM